MNRVDYVVVGAGIVGLATALELSRRGGSVLVLEKESGPAHHQTGRNSGVIHSGVYYRPGSLKAELCALGRESMYRFAEEHGIPFDRCGKLIVATDESQLDGLEELARRSRLNGLPIEVVDADGAREIEPHVNAVRAVHVPTTGIIDYAAVSTTLASLLVERGGEVRYGVEVVGSREEPGGVTIETTGATHAARQVVNCAGLHSDLVARALGAEPSSQIVPFRGEYFELRPSAHHLVRGLIYPVPDPELPFLGVHLTKMIDGGVHAGPNAVLALSREGYRWRDVDAREVARLARSRGMWKLGRRYYRTGWDEVRRSASRARFARSLQELVPDVTAEDLVPSPAGVRAQAITADGALVDDFVVQHDGHIVHVLNAPSPAATSSLEIAKLIADRVGG